MVAAAAACDVEGEDMLEAIEAVLEGEGIRQRDRLKAAICGGACKEAGSADVERWEREIRVLVEGNPDLLEEKLNDYGEKFMTLACKHEGNFFAVNFGIEKKPELVNQSKGDSGTTPLFTAAYFGNLKLMKLLLSKGACPHQRSTRGNNCSFIHNAIFGARDAQPTCRRAIYDALLTLIEESQKGLEESPFPPIPFLDANSLKHHIEECPHNGFEDICRHATEDAELAQRFHSVGLRLIAAMPSERSGPVGAVAHPLSAHSQCSRNSSLDYARSVLEQSTSALELYLQEGSFGKAVTPALWGGTIPVIGWEAVVIASSGGQPTLQQYVESQQWDDANHLGIEWSASAYHPPSKRKGDVGYMMHTLKPKKDGNATSAQAQQKYLVGERSRSTISVHVYFLYGDDGKRNPDRHFVCVLPAANTSGKRKAPP